MRLIMGVSADGYVALNAEDNMSWLGPYDKRVFRILTGVDGICAVGSKTYKVMPAIIHGRILICLSSHGFTLMKFHNIYYKRAWLLGGQTIAMEAFKEGIIEEVHLCRSKRPLNCEGIKETLSQYLIAPVMKTSIGDTVVEVYRQNGIRRHIVGMDEIEATSH